MNEQNLTPWKPGESGNPAGKPPGTKNLTTQVREALQKIAKSENGEDISYETLLVRRILKSSIEGGDNKMIQMIWEHLDGKPSQKIDLTHELGEETKESIAQMTEFFRSIVPPKTTVVHLPVETTTP